MVRRPNGEPAIVDFELRPSRAKNPKKKGKYFMVATPIKGGRRRGGTSITPQHKRQRLNPQTPQTPLGGTINPGGDIYEDGSYDLDDLPTGRVSD